VTTGKPAAGVDADEPRRAEAVASGLRRRITSVDRDDLGDGGARHFADVIAAARSQSADRDRGAHPDFRGAPTRSTSLAARPAVFSHNMETVPRLYRDARPGSEFDRSLALLAGAAERRDRGDYGGRVKTGLMLGLGEDEVELQSTLERIRDAGVEILTLGQYLQPTREHLPVRRWVHPDEFAALRNFALGVGFTHCEAGPLVRSSYHAHEHVAPSPSPVSA
jgi:lipoic acid synthetase